MNLKNFFTSGWNIEDGVKDIKSQYQMLNAGLILSLIGLVFGISSNIINENIYLVYVELGLITFNIIMFFILRKDRKYFNYVTHLLTAQFTVLFLYLIYISEPSAMKHVWLFTYPIILLYFDETKKAMIWLSFLVLMILIAPLQPFIEIAYSFHQVAYILFVVIIVSFIMYFYQIKINEAKNMIFIQQLKLENFNKNLDLEVKQKTLELHELNESLERKVKVKVKELRDKDTLITTQSKQAVMGEMISMIAHQWRQPLSTITLQISNLQIKRLLGDNITVRESDKVLDEISKSIVYLSDTIDDFQTYFRPNKEQETIAVDELLQKAINFALPRTKENNVEIINETKKGIVINIFVNEIIQVILNLINNALDAFNGINKQDCKVILDAQENENSITIFVKDNANGISEKNLSYIFEPYFSTKGKNGTGLGLYMSQMIIEKQFFGNIKVQTSDKGTTFIVEISKHSA